MDGRSLVTGVQIVRNPDGDPTWTASGKIGSSSFYGASDDLSELKQWIAEAEAEEAGDTVGQASGVAAT